MIENRHLVEESLRSKTQSIVDAFAQALAGKGLTTQSAKITVRNGSIESYTSEIVVYIYRDGQIADALEFAVFSNGNQNVSEREVERWVTSELGKLV